MTYTEHQIHDLSGRELDVAFCEIMFGDDLTANTEERIEQACAPVLSVYNCGKGLSVNVRVYGNPTDMKIKHGVVIETARWAGNCVIPFQNADRPGMFDYSYIWNSRHGKPYQSDLEQHVANWRAEPNVGDVWELFGVTSNVLDGAVTESPCLAKNDGENWHVYDGKLGLKWMHLGNFLARGETPEEAIKRAAIIAKLREAE